MPDNPDLRHQFAMLETTTKADIKTMQADIKTARAEGNSANEQLRSSFERLRASFERLRTSFESLHAAIAQQGKELAVLIVAGLVLIIATIAAAATILGIILSNQSQPMPPIIINTAAPIESPATPTTPPPNTN